jgi:hypothetical protein
MCTVFQVNKVRKRKVKSLGIQCKLHPRNSQNGISKQRKNLNPQTEQISLDLDPIYDGIKRDEDPNS